MVDGYPAEEGVGFEGIGVVLEHEFGVDIAEGFEGYFFGVHRVVAGVRGDFF